MERDFGKVLRRGFAQQQLRRFGLRLRQRGLAKRAKGQNGKRQNERQRAFHGGLTRFPARRFGRYLVMMGRSMMKVVPLFSSLSARISPSCKSTIWRTMDRPRPVPPVSRERALSTR